jgi:SAM-dependent methyltransferase
MSTASKFTRDGVRDYEKRRYRGLDQRIVHAREMRLLRKAFARIDRETAPAAGAGERRVLDLPCGYGRFTPFLSGLGRAVVNSDLSLEMVRRAAEASGTPGAAANATAGLPFKDGSF